jgi:hypothetical protein
MPLKNNDLAAPFVPDATPVTTRKAAFRQTLVGECSETTCKEFGRVPGVPGVPRVPGVPKVPKVPKVPRVPKVPTER